MSNDEAVVEVIGIYSICANGEIISEGNDRPMCCEEVQFIVDHHYRKMENSKYQMELAKEAIKAARKVRSTAANFPEGNELKELLHR
jgi:Fe-S-cluster containining protein